MSVILAMIRKELTHVFRDRIMTMQILLAPVLQLLLFSHVATFEVREVRMAVVDHDRSPASGRLVEGFLASGLFRSAGAVSDVSADRALLDRRATMVLRVPAGFERDLRRRGAAPVQIVLNAEDGAAAGVIRGHAGRVLERFARAEEASLGLAASAGGAALRPAALEIRSRARFNEEGRYVAFMSVGILALLMTLVGTLVTAQNLAREKELGTIEQLNATPVTRGQFIAGKLLPFWLLGLVEFCAGLVIIRFVLGVELVGAVPLAIVGAAVYLVCALGLGLLISTAVDTQQQAMFIVFFVMMIFLFMGGLFTPVSSMPRWAQLVAEANPIKHFIALLRGVLLRGAGPADVARELLVLTAMAAGALGLAVARYRKTVA